MLLFLKIMFTEFIAEMGDKTQLMLIAFTSKYKPRDIVIGTAAAILVLNGIAVLAGGLIGSLVPEWLVKLIAAAAFLYFAFVSLNRGGDDDEESSEKGSFRFAPVTVFCTFFVAELGDKTQLTAMTFGANEGLSVAVTVWLACSVGLFAADMIGMLVGYLLNKKMPENFLSILSFAIFAVFGVWTAYQGITLLLPEHAAIITIAVAVVFAAVCLLFRCPAKRGK